MALTFNLAAIPLKYVAFPVVAGLAAGTGAVAAYVTTGPHLSPRSPSRSSRRCRHRPRRQLRSRDDRADHARQPAKKLSCEKQTWPYIDNRCIARKGDERAASPRRAVRRVVERRAKCPRTAHGGCAGPDHQRHGAAAAAAVDASDAEPEPKLEAARETQRDRRQA